MLCCRVLLVVTSWPELIEPRERDGVRRARDPSVAPLGQYGAIPGVGDRRNSGSESGRRIHWRSWETMGEQRLA